MKNFTCIFFLSVIFSCNHAVKEKNSEYFEGVVEFKINVITNNQTIETAFKKMYGCRMVNYISKNGFYSREYIDSNDIIIKREIYNPDSVRIYTYGLNHDTISYADTHKTYWVETEFPANRPTKKILNEELKGVCVNNTSNNIFTGTKIKVNSVYYNNPKYKFNPRGFDSIIYCGINKLFKQAPYITVGYVNEVAGVAKMETLATSVKKQPVSNSIFNLPAGYILIEREY